MVGAAVTAPARRVHAGSRHGGGENGRHVGATDAAPAANSVRLTGRLSVDPERRELPSGDTLVLLRVVVERPDGSRRDSLPVVVGPAPVRGQRRRPGQAAAATVRRAAALAVGDDVVVEGWLERRFWRAGDARRTRLQVVAERVARP